MLYEVTVHIIGEHKTSVDKWKIKIRSRSALEARARAIDVAQLSAAEKFSRYRNCTFAVRQQDVLPIGNY